MRVCVGFPAASTRTSIREGPSGLRDPTWLSGTDCTWEPLAMVAEGWGGQYSDLRNSSCGVGPEVRAMRTPQSMPLGRGRKEPRTPAAIATVAALSVGGLSTLTLSRAPEAAKCTARTVVAAVTSGASEAARAAE